MIITLENISKHYAGEQVLNNAALTIEDSDRIGLIGINGCGKSTLLRIIAGLEIPDSQPEPNPPHISAGKNKSIGFLAQNSGLNGESTIIDEMKGVFRELLGIAARLEEIRNNHLTQECADEYSKKTAYFESNDGYLTDIKINKVLRGMGFPPLLHERVISTLSGGEKTRLALAKLLLENPSLLILDEPTNHLDFETVLWLEDYLKDYKGALLIVSHDRYFLDKLVTSVCEIERGSLRRFKGNYTAFTAQKAEYVERQMKEYETQAAEIAKLKDYIARNIVRASTSNMAKSRVKQLERLEANLVQKPVINEKSAKIKFEYDREPPKDVLTVKNVELIAGSGVLGTGVLGTGVLGTGALGAPLAPADGNPPVKVLVNSLTFSVHRGERLAVVGANGSGKSTLLKALQRKHPYSRGSIEWGENVKISYFDQINTDVFDENDSVINSVHKLYPRMTELQVRTLLGGVRLIGDDVYKKVEDLSGGERAKLRLAIMTLERGNVLILDEPTNHLDIATRDVLETALCSYSGADQPGTVIFVSHDRYLLNKLATRIIEITPDGVNNYNGGFAEYIELKQSRRETQDETGAPKASLLQASRPPSGNYRSKEQRVQETQKRVRINQLESEIERLEAAVSDLQNEMESPEVFINHELLQEKCALYEESKERLALITDEWLELNG
jgi:ATP-binding cassette subfamily F protein 3